MLNVAGALGGAYFAKKSNEGTRVPTARGGKDACSFKLSVRVISAAAPALPAPGLLSRQRPRMEASLGEVSKDTELADYAAPGAQDVGICAREQPWRFGDTLTFVVASKDVIGHPAPPGLRIRLRAHSDYQLGPVQLSLSSTSELGEAAVDLMKRALPACVGSRRQGQGGVSTWDSPHLLIPLSNVRGGVVPAGHQLGEAVGHVTLAFSIDKDPEALLAALEARSKTTADVVTERAARVTNAVEEKADKAWIFFGQEFEEPAWMKRLNDALAAPVDSDSAVAQATERQQMGAVRTVDNALGDPDLDPEGWVSRIGKNGQRHWHHRALGPAPWETDQEARELGKEVAFARPGPTGRPPGSGCGYYPGSSIVSGPGSFAESSADQPPSFSEMWKDSHRRGGQLPPMSPEGAGQRSPKTWSGPVTGGGGLAGTGQSQSALAAMSRDMPFPSPEQATEDWVSFEGPNGRTFWHNQALGPAPWAQQKIAAPPPAPSCASRGPSGLRRPASPAWHNAQSLPSPPPMPPQAG